MLLLSVLKEAPKNLNLTLNIPPGWHGAPRNCLYSDYAKIHS